MRQEGAGSITHRGMFHTEIKEDPMGYFSSIHFTSRPSSALAVWFVALGLFCPIAALAQSTGLIVDRFNPVRVFDLSADEVTFSVPPNGFAIGDCSMSDDESSAWLPIYGNTVVEVDLTAVPPAAPILWPISISNSGQDTVLTPDRAYLLVAGGASPQPLSVVDVASRTEKGTYDLGGTHTSVDVCEDGTVLTTSASHYVYSAVIDSGGVIIPPVMSLSNAGDQNVYCAPGSDTGVAVDKSGRALNSFSISPLALSSTVATTDDPLAAVFSADGTVIFVRTLTGVESYEYDPHTGVFGDQLWTYSVLASGGYYGVDLLMLHSDESRLYVSGGATPVITLNPADGTSIDSIHGLYFTPQGLCRAEVSTAAGAGAEADSDLDGIDDAVDICPDTFADEPTKILGINRWIWDGTDWITESNGGEGPDDAFTMADTQGCSCEQILDVLVAETGQDFSGHYKMGCSSGVLNDWIEGY